MGRSRPMSIFFGEVLSLSLALIDDTPNRRFVLKTALHFAPGLAGLLPERHAVIVKASHALLSSVH